MGKTERNLSQRVHEHQKQDSSAYIQHLTANPAITIFNYISKNFNILKRKLILNKQIGSQYQLKHI